MQHKDVELLDDVESKLLQEVIAYATVEQRLEGLSPEEILEKFSPEQRLKGLSAKEVLEKLPPEQLLEALSEKELEQLRTLLEQKKPRE